ncbi:hypothetical protein [Streptomyces sp. NPDC091879]|jgi:hypothetical protein|uniref:hypothetical protein n=1 Tax=Streptomyces sp. NPDC091879 TaxID=3366006 RepID=UPI0037F152A4
MTATDDRPTMYLGHLVIPRESAAQDWLKRQGEQREAAVEIVALEAKKWFGLNLPDSAYENFAQRVVAAIDQRI